MSINICNYVFIGFKIKMDELYDRINNEIYQDEKLTTLFESYQCTEDGLFISMDDNYLIGGYCLGYNDRYGGFKKSIVLDIDFLNHFQIEHYLTDSFMEDMTKLFGNIDNYDTDFGIIVHTQYN